MTDEMRMDQCVKFYRMIPGIVHSASGQSLPQLRIEIEEQKRLLAGGGE